ncbi:hypothetical protein ROZALSC1DRAFT_29034 [Rozella allomycis CSF55]|uniref:Mediator of RNA polymerase II transcription subunit 4 n=1 Tax=Rozella allomycis (strain CSF55) TaxID=988480 RepID=A0A4P9YIF0_ROZAC|nr:hypothetical protein ROZALSC1DRAFT_29034 [Rozella allomycis CSF55]
MKQTLLYEGRTIIQQIKIELEKFFDNFDNTETLVELQNKLHQWREQVESAHQMKVSIDGNLQKIDEIKKQRQKAKVHLIRLKEELEEFLKEKRKRLEYMKLACDNPLELNELLFYAQKISSSTSAPHNWDSSKPLGLFKPPNPQEDMMRSRKHTIEAESEIENKKFGESLETNKIDQINMPMGKPLPQRKEESDEEFDFDNF